MKPLTTNRVKTFAKNNVYIQNYIENRAKDSNEIYQKIGKNPTIRFSNGYETDYKTNKSNDLYYFAHKEFKNKFKFNPDKTLQFFNVEINGLIWSCNLNFDITGKAKIEIRGCKIDNNRIFTKLPFINEYSLIFSYEGILTTEAAQRTASKKINEYLHPNGFFRQLQYEFWATKERAKELYKQWNEQRKELIGKYDSAATHKAIKRHLNLATEYLTDEVFFNAAKRISKKDELTYVEKFDFSIMDNFDGDIDEIEQLFYNEMDFEKIYI